MAIELDGLLGISATGNITTDGYYYGNGVHLTGINAGNANAIVGANSSISIDANGNAVVNINNSNIATFTPTGLQLNGNLIPSSNIAYTLGNATNQWKDLWVSNSTIYMNSIPINLTTATLSNGATVDTLAVSSWPIIVQQQANAQLGNLTVASNISAPNIAAASFNWSNGTPIISNTGNLDITTISATGNITGNALIANSANISGDIYFNSGYAAAEVSAAGNVTAGNLITTGTIVSTGDVLTAGNVSATGNITGNYIIGNGSQLTGLPAQYGNVNVAAYLANANTAGDIYGGNISAYGNVEASGNVTVDNFLNVQAITGAAMQISATGLLQNISLSATGNIDVGSTFINRVSDPIQAQDAATKYYVDASAQGLNVKNPVVAATAAALPAYTYNNGNVGVGATITAIALGNLVVDGVTLTTNNRVLVKNETAGNAPYNGIYQVTTAGNSGTAFILTRTVDNDTQSEIVGGLVFADQGNVNGATSWFDTNTPTVTVGTTPITWVQFSSSGVGAGNGLTQSGHYLNVNTDGVTTEINGSNQVAVKASANLVTPNIGNAVGNSLTLAGPGNINTSGTVTAGYANVAGNVITGNILTDHYLYANGTPLSFNTSGINNGSSNIDIPVANSSIIFTVANTFAGAVGSNVVILGNTSGTNGFYVKPVRNDLSNIANVVYYNATTNELTYAPTAPTYGNVNVAAYLANATTNGDIYGGAIRANGVISATGNVTVGNNLSVAANTTVGGTLSTAGNITGGANLAVTSAISAGGNITGGNLSVGTGNIIAGNIESSYYTTPVGTNGNITIDPDGTGVFVITARTPTYFANTANSTSTTTGAVTYAGGVGIAGNLNVGGNFSAGNTTFSTIVATTSGNIGNLTVPGTTALTGNATTGNIATTGVISATANVTGGNLLTSGLVSATGNATAGNVITPGVVQATGNISTASNLVASGYVFAAGNVTGANLTTAGTANVGTLTVAGNATVALNATVTGNVTGGNLRTAGIVSATGNATAGNVLTGGQVSATGNVTGGNINTSGNANVTGNLTVNYVFASGNVVATGNVDALNVNTGNVYGNIIEITATGTDSDISLNTNGNGNIVLNSTYINGLLNPVQAQDAASKAYVDSVATGLQVKQSSNVATAAGLPAYSYNNGTFGVGATLTGSANGVLIIDTVTLTGGERVLVKDETSTNAPYNGIYDVTVPGDAGNAYVLTRSTDDDTPADMYAAYTFIESGATNGTTSWTCTAVATSPINIGFDAINWVQFSSSAQYQAGNGLTLTGTVFSVNVDNNTTAISGANVIVKAGANLTTPNIGNATGNSLTLTGTGNISGGNLSMSGIAAVTGNLSAGNIATGIVSATGNVTGSNLRTGGSVSATGNATAGNISTAGDLYVGGKSTQAGNISALGQLFIGPTANATTLTGPVIFAQGAANAFSQIGLINVNGNSSADMITYANNGSDVAGYADMGMTGNTYNDLNYTITKPNDGYFFVQGVGSTGGNLVIASGDQGNTHDIVLATGGFLAANEKLRLVDAANTLQPYANLSLNLGSTTKYFGNVYANSLTLAENFTANNISAVNNVSGVNLSATGIANIGVTNITGNLTVTGNSNVSGNSSVVGTITAGGLGVGVGNISGNNISGNSLTISGITNLGLVNNLKVTGGANGQSLTTDGTGNLTWTTITGGSGNAIAAIPAVYFTAVANANNLSFSNVILSGYANAEAMMVFYNGALLENSLYALSGDTLTINTPLVVGDTIDVPTQYGGNINTVNSGYGNSNVAAFFANYAGNIIPSADNAYALGNATNRWNTVYSANVLATTVSATGNVIGGNIVGGAITGSTVSTTGNITGANIRTGGTLSSTGNVVAGGGYFNGNVTITGNAAIQGNLTYNNLTNLTTANLVLGLGNTQTGANVTGGGLVVGNTNEAQFLYNFSSQSWVSNIAITSNTAINGANLAATTNVTAGANVIAGNVNVSSSVSVAGNIVVSGNLLGNVTGTQVNATTISASGNITGANVVAVTLSATGNVVANNVGNITPVNLNGSSSQFLAGDGTWKSPGASTLRNITKIDALGNGSILMIADDRLFSIKGNGDATANYTTGLGYLNADVLSGVNNCYEIQFPNEVPGTLSDAGSYGYSAYALFSNGNLYTWGYNSFGQLGLGNTTNTFLPTLSNTNVAQVYTHPSNNESEPTYQRLIIRKTDNTYYGVGYNGEGQFGNGTIANTNSTWTQLVNIPTTALSVWNIGAYRGVTVIQKADGSIWVAGYNGTGQLGLGNTTDATTFTAAPAWLGGDNTMRIQTIVAGQRYYDGAGYTNVFSITMFLDNGTGSLLLASGSNNWGNFGNGNTTQQNSPVAPLATTGLSGRIAKVRGVGSAVMTMFVQTASGNLYTYGYNGQGCVGNGTSGNNQTTPYLVFAGDCADIIGDQQGWWYNSYFTPTPLVKKTDGTYWAWGYNPYGQTGSGFNTTNILVPNQARFNKGTSIKFLSTLSTNNEGIAQLAVTTDNTIIAYGYNVYWAIDPAASNQNLIVPATFTPNNLRK